MAGYVWCPNCWERFPLYFRVCPECKVDFMSIERRFTL